MRLRYGSQWKTIALPERAMVPLPNGKDLHAVGRVRSELKGRACGPFRLSPGLFLEIDIGKLLTVVVTHDEAGVQFFDRPWRRREATSAHGADFQRKHSSVTSITERLTGLSDCACKETRGGHHENAVSGDRVRDRNGFCLSSFCFSVPEGYLGTRSLRLHEL
jgi:hypothetical protein